MNYTKARIIVRKKLSITNAWVAVDDGIIIDTVLSPKSSEKLGKKKDTFNFNLDNTNNMFNETYYSGDNNTTDFNVKWGPIPLSHQSGAFKKLNVYVDDVEVFDYSFINNNTTISFTTAPATGVNNIKLVYPIVEEDDLVRMYRIKNTNSFTDSDIMIDGTITTVSGSTNCDNKNLAITGNSLLTQLFKGLVFTRPSGSLNYAHQYIQDVIAQINQFNQDRPIYGESALEWTTIGNTESTKDIQYSMSYKTAIEIIEDLSKDEHTGNGQHIYYLLYDSVNERYQFKWLAKDTTSNYNLVESENKIVDVKLTVDNDEVINAAIYNTGQDCEGNSMEFPFFDFTSGGGSKWKYITSTNTIAETLIINEFENNSSIWDSQTLANGTKVRTSNYPNSYIAYAMQFEDRDDSGAKNGNSVTPNNDTDFNDAIWKEAKWQGWAMAKGIIDVWKDPRRKLIVELDYGSGTSTFTMGNICTCTFPSYGMDEVKLRIIQIDKTLTSTTIHLTEDEVTINE